MFRALDAAKRRGARTDVVAGHGQGSFAPPSTISDMPPKPLVSCLAAMAWRGCVGNPDTTQTRFRCGHEKLSQS